MKSILVLLCTAVSALGQVNEAIVSAGIRSYEVLRIHEAYQIGSAIEVIRVESDFLIPANTTVFSEPFPLDGPTIAITRLQNKTDSGAGVLTLDENGNEDYIIPEPELPQGARSLSKRSVWPASGDWVTNATWSPDPNAPWVESPQYGGLHLANYPWVYWEPQQAWIYVTEAGIIRNYNAYWHYIPDWGSWFYSSKEHPKFLYSWEESAWFSVD